MTRTRASSDNARTISIVWRSAMPSSDPGGRTSIATSRREQLLALAHRHPVDPTRATGWRPANTFSATDRSGKTVGCWWITAIPWRWALGGAADRRLRPVDQDATAVGLMDAAEDLDERTLPGAILTCERMNAPGVQIEIDIAQHLDGPEPLADRAQLNERSHATRPARAISWIGKVRAIRLPESQGRLSCAWPAPALGRARANTRALCSWPRCTAADRR